MASQVFEENLDQIASSRYGRDMRSAIHDCIEELGELFDIIGIATITNAGLVKPDGSTISIDSNGTISTNIDLSQIQNTILNLENRITALERYIHDPASIAISNQNGETTYIDYEPTNVNFITQGG